MHTEKDIKLFNEEWQSSIAKFKSITGLKSLNINLKHPVTNQPTTAYEQLPDIYKQWLEIKSVWDKQSLLFSVI